MITIKDYHYWLRAAIKELRDLKDLHRRINELRKQMNKFNNISLGDAKRHRDKFDREYAEMQNKLEKCEKIFTRMKEFGKAMEFYASENRSIIHSKIDDMKRKYNRFIDIMEQDKRREKMIK